MDNQVRLTKYRVEYDDIEADQSYIRCFNSLGAMMNWVCRQIAFDDIMPYEFTKISAKGRFLRYTGWQPEMRMTFIDTETREVIWDEYYPEYDH